MMDINFTEHDYNRMLFDAYLGFYEGEPYGHIICQDLVLIIHTVEDNYGCVLPCVSVYDGGDGILMASFLWKTENFDTYDEAIQSIQAFIYDVLTAEPETELREYEN